MQRWILVTVCSLGWLLLGAAVVLPLAGSVWAIIGDGGVAVRPAGGSTEASTAAHSLLLAVIATAVGLALSIMPAAVLGTCSRRTWPWLLGLVLAPLLVPPQVYAYAWELVVPTGMNRWAGGVFRAGSISGAWLWPIAALIIASAWRSSGHHAWQLALLDASPTMAFVRVVLPSLQPALTTAGCVVAAISVIEYAIPHLTLCHVWSTELMVLVEVGAPRGQIVRMAVQPLLAVGVLVVVAAGLQRGSAGWQPVEDDTTFEAAGRLKRNWAGTAGLTSWLGMVAVWLGSLGLPVVLMTANLRDSGAWQQGLTMFARQWADSLQVAGAAGLGSVLIAVATVVWWRASGRRGPQWAAPVVLLSAIVPPPVLGVGLVLVFNRGGLIGELYSQTPLVWILALVGRYAAVAVLIAWMSLGRRTILAIEQARVDGGTDLDILGHVLLPRIWPSLMAAGLIVAVLALFEVVVTQMTVPPVYGSIAMTILNYMHYGRDDVVITSSLMVMVAGVLVTQLCARLLSRVGQ